MNFNFERVWNVYSTCTIWNSSRTQQFNIKQRFWILLYNYMRQWNGHPEHFKDQVLSIQEIQLGDIGFFKNYVRQWNGHPDICPPMFFEYIMWTDKPWILFWWLVVLKAETSSESKKTKKNTINFYAILKCRDSYI